MVKTTEKKIEDFEIYLKKLEGIVEKLESGQLGLHENLQEFEKGVHLYNECKKILENSQEKITKLTELLEEKPINLLEEES